MIDLHAHILPGVDDGPATMDSSLMMARIAVSEGIDTVVATPHHLNGVYCMGRTDILAACKKMNGELENRQIPLTILPGSEVHLCPEIMDDYANDRLMTLNDSGKYFFLEMPDHFIAAAVRSLISRLVRLNTIPIIAHPERNLTIQRDTALLSGFTAAGALTQITGASLLGAFGTGTRTCCRQLLADRSVHLMASDAHSPDHRPPALRKAHQALAGLVGSDRADWMLKKAPKQIIDGQPLNTPWLQ